VRCWRESEAVESLRAAELNKALRAAVPESDSVRGCFCATQHRGRMSSEKRERIVDWDSVYALRRRHLNVCPIRRGEVLGVRPARSSPGPNAIECRHEPGSGSRGTEGTLAVRLAVSRPPALARMAGQVIPTWWRRTLARMQRPLHTSSSAGHSSGSGAHHNGRLRKVSRLLVSSRRTVRRADSKSTRWKKGGRRQLRSASIRSPGTSHNPERHRKQAAVFDTSTCAGVRHLRMPCPHV
jgi:hypothetical protein